MRLRWLVIVLSVITLLVVTPFQPVLAARGAPGSAEFGYGAHLNLSGAYAIDGVRLASDLQLDWLAIDLDWQSIAPKNGTVDWTRLDPILQSATNSHVPVMVSLQKAPGWAQTPQGPNPDLVSQMVSLLAQRYPKAIQAIELFPGANTTQGWGKPANAQAYIKVLKTALEGLKKNKSSIFLVAGGLQPLPHTNDPAQGIDDLVFLQTLYQNGLKELVNVITAQGVNLSGEPLQAPEKSENRVLRHYEEIRSVMLANHHDSGLIWITHLSAPTGQINSADQKYQDVGEQVNWLNQAYAQLKSQLYIGVAFLNGINPSVENPAALTLIEANGDYHPFFRSLRDLIAVNHSDNSLYRPGRPKDQPLQKSVK
jgi:hypothetical protein